MIDLKISGGYVYDPANGLDGQVRDLWVHNGRIVENPSHPDEKPVRHLNAAGLVVMPGGVDMHCHIAGPKVNTARKMRPEEKRRDTPVRRTASTHSGSMGSVPSTFATGYKYLGLGYTTAFDAAVPPLSARHAHEEFEDTPCIDKGFYVLMGNNHYVMNSIQNQELERLQAFVGWLLGAAKGYAAKLVNPGGVEVWKHHQAGNVSGLDEPVDHFGVTPRQIIREVAHSVDRLGSPHAVHVHCN
ncbi:MAG: formylmethanofuran dehydrogenase subunit A, partial [Planctomycetaceae bacterium]|nr:formylmethanofuran dehydrogenase subunit A [Planctomycetaceae bacterium]